jgi:4-hydroxyproline epimerase
VKKPTLDRLAERWPSELERFDCILYVLYEPITEPTAMKTEESFRKMTVIDSHTAGEPTRCVLTGAPESVFGKSAGSLTERVERLKREHDDLRKAILYEPRGSDVLVGAYLLEPDEPDCTAAVVFFNNAGYLGMCGHGTIGVAVTLAYLGRITAGTHRLQTPVGVVRVHLKDAHTVTVENVPAYRYKTDARVSLPDGNVVTGDVAWGGNWFFLTQDHGQQLALDNVEELTEYAWRIRTQLADQGVTGANGVEIDHIELFSPPLNAENHSRNFVLCPGKAYDRSPCGTGTSAKLACLIADGKITPGEAWRQEGILGTVFEGRARVENDALHPSITGSAYITAEAILLFDSEDPFRNGIDA